MTIYRKYLKKNTIVNSFPSILKILFNSFQLVYLLIALHKFVKEQEHYCFQYSVVRGEKIELWLGADFAGGSE